MNPKPKPRTLHLLTLTAYTLLTVFFTWPTAARLTTAIPGDGFDGWQNYWNQWWIKEALLNRHTHFFYTDLLYPPEGVSLIFHTLNFFNGLWTLPVQLNFGLAVAYNAVVFFHFVLAGYGVYLLARYTMARLGFRDARAALAAFIGGAIFTFSPFHMAHLLGHMQVLSLTWPPFYVLWLLRLLNRWRSDPAAPLPRRDLALCGLFLAFTTMVDWYQTLYLLLFTALSLAWALWRAWKDAAAPPRALATPLLGLAAMGLAFGLVFSPLLLPMTREAATADYMRPSFQENVILSADLLAFFTPSELHPLWGRAVQPIYNTFTTTTSERLLFAGWIPLALGVVAAVRFRRRRLGQFWILFTLAFAVLALGPYLHVAGRVVAIGGVPLPLPYLLLYKVVPFIGVSRSLSRFDLMVMIGLGVLASLALVRARPARQLLALALIGFEFLAIPFPMSPLDTPDFFRTLAADPADYTIAYLPMNWDRPVPLLYQTVHHKRLLTAYTSRDNPLDPSWRTPVLQQWRTLRDDIIQADLPAIAPTVFRDFNLKYIVLDYYQMPPGPEREGTEKWVAAALPNVEPVYRDDRLTVYLAPTPDAPRPYLQLGDGWGDLSPAGGEATRTAGPVATLAVRHPGDAPLRLTVTAAPPHTLAGLSAFAGDVPLPLTLAGEGQTAVISLPPGTTGVRLTLPP
ncbi:MAG: hypothetical protein D6796_13015, partial [Caldilineae bacterium]